MGTARLIREPGRLLDRLPRTFQVEHRGEHVVKRTDDYRARLVDSLGDATPRRFLATFSELRDRGLPEHELVALIRESGSDYLLRSAGFVRRALPILLEQSTWGEDSELVTVLWNREWLRLRAELRLLLRRNDPWVHQRSKRNREALKEPTAAQERVQERQERILAALPGQNDRGLRSVAHAAQRLTDRRVEFLSGKSLERDLGKLRAEGRIDGGFRRVSPTTSSTSSPLGANGARHRAERAHAVRRTFARDDS